MLWQVGRTLVRAALPLGVGLAVLGAWASASYADTTTTTANVQGGTLAESVYATPDPIPTVILNGTDKTATFSFVIDANDPTGTGNGWKVQLTSDTFAIANPTPGATPVHSLSTSASTVTGATASCKQGTCTNPTNSVSYTSLTVPAGATPPAAVSIFDAAANTGMGEFLVTPSFQIGIPANTYAGAYASTLTLSIASGP
jgi:hypothetical protein